MSRKRTVTLDEDVAERLDDAARSSGQPLRAVANDALRRGLETPKETRPTKPKPFRVKSYNMGLRPGFNIDCTGELLDQLEGPYRR